MKNTDSTSGSKRDLHHEITQNIIKAIEEGEDGKGFKPPWIDLSSGGLPQNAQTKRRYRGVNILQLWAEQGQRGYSSPYWASYKQWAKLGAQVRKGEKGTPIVFYKRIKIEGKVDEEGHLEDDKIIPLLRYSTVFNADQVDGWEIPDPPERPDVARLIPEIEEAIKATGAEIKYNGGRAFYNRDADRIEIPERDLFTSTEGFYSTEFHELTHWSGHKDRLDRTFGKRFGDKQYAAEELVAELGATFMAAELGIEAEPRQDHAKYVANWLQLLREDDKAIFTAAAKASDAAEYLLHSEDH